MKNEKKFQIQKLAYVFVGYNLQHFAQKKL